MKALFAHGKQNWISGAYIICAKQSHHSFFPLKQNSKPPTDSSGAELHWRIKLTWNSEAFQDNYQYIKPRTSSLMAIFSHLLQAAILSLPCERLLLSVKKKEQCSKSYKMKSSSIIISLKFIACRPMKALQASWWQQLQILILTV